MTVPAHQALDDAGTALLRGLAIALVVLLVAYLRSSLRVWLAAGLLARDLRRLSAPAYQVIEGSIAEARRLGHRDLGTEHLLLGIVLQRDGVGERILEQMRVAVDDIRSQVENMVWKAGNAPRDKVFFTVNFVEAIRRAIREARSQGYPYAGTQHLLLALLQDKGCVASRILSDRGVTSGAVREAILRWSEMEEPQA